MQVDEPQVSPGSGAGKPLAAKAKHSVKPKQRPALVAKRRLTGPQKARKMKRRAGGGVTLALVQPGRLRLRLNHQGLKPWRNQNSG